MGRFGSIILPATIACEITMPAGVSAAMRDTRPSSSPAVLRLVSTSLGKRRPTNCGTGVGVSCPGGRA